MTSWPNIQNVNDDGELKRKSMEKTTNGIMSSETKIISGSVYPELARKTAEAFGGEVIDHEGKRFANSEKYVRIADSVRGDNVFIIQSMAERNGWTVDESIIETLLLVDAAKRASAKQVTIIVPYLAYGRQDRKARGREPISAAAIIRALQSAGADRIVSVDMHSAQAQGVFNGPFDHLTAEPDLQRALKKDIKNTNKDDVVVVSPDAGRVKEAEEYASMLGVDSLHIPKIRKNNQIHRVAHIEGIEGKTAIITDDMVDTAGTLITAADVLNASGAARIIVAATHGILSDPALERLQGSTIDKLFISDTVDNTKAKKILGDRLEIVPIHQLLADVIGRIAEGGSVSDLFGGKNYK